MIVSAIPIGARLVDTTAGLTLAELKAMRAGGIEGLIAYLGGNLTPQLLEDALSADLGVCPVNFSRGELWMPTATLGKQDAAVSLTHLAALKCPVAGLVDWCDLEGSGGNPTSYLDAWSEELLGDGAQRVAGLYVGAGGLLTGVQLYALPGFTRYWRSLSNVPEPDCGFVLNQLYPTTAFNGTPVDYDFAQLDYRGRAATWLVAG